MVPLVQAAENCDALVVRVRDAEGSDIGLVKGGRESESRTYFEHLFVRKFSIGTHKLLLTPLLLATLQGKVEEVFGKSFFLVLTVRFHHLILRFGLAKPTIFGFRLYDIICYSPFIEELVHITGPKYKVNLFSFLLGVVALRVVLLLDGTLCGTEGPAALLTCHSLAFF